MKPNAAELRALQNALGSNFSKITVKSGIEELALFVRTFFL
jgi:hypothetical protein